MKLINDNLQHIKALCQKHKVSKLFVFGSVLTPRFNNQSDVDLLVDFHKEEVDDYFNNFFDLKYALEKLLGKNVDLVEGQTIKNPYLKKDIDQHKVLIYG
jgi:predicted nucleotidyltransferase